jgi:hypothetical protein
MKKDPVAKYEVWGRKEVGKGQRYRLAFGFSTEADARSADAKLKAQGFQDTVVVQRPPRYGCIAGLQKTGLQKNSI